MAQWRKDSGETVDELGIESRNIAFLLIAAYFLNDRGFLVQRRMEMTEGRHDLWFC